MQVLVIGSGGREHALCHFIAQSSQCKKLYCAPGNAGIATPAECLPITITDNATIIDACHKHHIDFVVIGPDAQLEQGLADALRKAGILCFGPSRAAAEIEWSKKFMKELCLRMNVPTAAYASFNAVEPAKSYIRHNGAPIVIKADGLSAGKGVTVAQSVEEAIAAIDDAMVNQVFGAAGKDVVIEEFMQGEEVSFFVLSDGKTARFFTSAQDHKAVFDGDKGPNTGGMGAYSPSPLIDDVMEKRIMHEIIDPILQGLHDIGRPFSGVLYAGLMMTSTGPRVVEFNARFGDPETQIMLPRLASDLLPLLYACATGTLDQAEMTWKNETALTVVMATQGYPGTYGKGSIIRGVDEASSLPEVIVFHAGTKRDTAGNLSAHGGRVLCVTATGNTIAEAQKGAYSAVRLINWPEGFCRSDIGWRAIAGRTTR